MCAIDKPDDNFKRRDITQLLVKFAIYYEFA
jgi:hypothetical protein